MDPGSIYCTPRAHHEDSTLLACIWIYLLATSLRRGHWAGWKTLHPLRWSEVVQANLRLEKKFTGQTLNHVPNPVSHRPGYAVLTPTPFLLPLGLSLGILLKHFPVGF